MLKLSNDNMAMKFDEDNPSSGFSEFKLKADYYYMGYARSTNLNNINSRGEYILSTSDFYSLLIEGVEHEVSSLDWGITKIKVNSKDLYGEYDVYGGVNVDVIKVKTESILATTGNRSIKEQELWYYFTPDGKGIIKKVKIIFNPPVSSAYNLQSIKVLNFVSVNSIAPKFEVESYFFGKKQLGFDYDTLSEVAQDWIKDSGLTISIARNSVYPNLLPAFDPADWNNLPDIYNSSSIDLKAGDKPYISWFNAYPDARKHYLHFEAQNLTGTLQVSFSMTRNNRNTEIDAQIINITDNGEHIITFPAGYGYDWLYVRFNQLDGVSNVINPYVHYRDLSYTFVAPDGSRLANSNLMNCIRVQSSNPNNKKITTKVFNANLFIGSGKGVGISILSLDGTDIQNGAFEVLFQKSDNTIVTSAIYNMFVDYNEKYVPVGDDPIAEQFNQWDDGLFGVAIPAGVDEIKKIGIRFKTTQAIDWLIDNFFVLNWQGSDKGIGSDDRRNFGPGVDGLRSRDFSLRGTHGITFPRNYMVKMERVIPDPETASKLTFSNVTGIKQIYYLVEIPYSVTFSDLQDRGHEAIIDMSGETNYLYAVSVKNSATGEMWRIKSAVGTDIIVDIAERERNSSSDLIIVTYMVKMDIDPTTVWSFVPGGILWDIGASLYSSAYVDYYVSRRIDDPIGLAQVSSDSQLSTMRVLRLDVALSPPLLANYNIATLTDAENTLCETDFTYYPTKDAITEEISYPGWGGGGWGAQEWGM